MRRFFPAFLCLLAGVIETSVASSFDASGADELRYGITAAPDALTLRVLGAGVDRPEQAVFVVLRTGDGSGAALLPSENGMEGSPVWLPFQADVLLTAKSTGDGAQTFVRRWNGLEWGKREAGGIEFTAAVEPSQMTLRISQKIMGKSRRLDMAVYMKDFAADGGRGRFYGAMDRAVLSGTGERVLRRYVSVELGKDGTTFTQKGLGVSDGPRLLVCQVASPLFGKTNPAGFTNATSQKNGPEKFGELNPAALSEIKAMGFTHVWLSGLIRHTSEPSQEDVGSAADEPDVFEDEFKALVGSIHGQGLKVLIDLDPDRLESDDHSALKPEKTVPNTWDKMDVAVAHWQGWGVDGFLVNHAATIPPEFWRWLIQRARARQPDVFFVARIGGDQLPSMPVGDAGARTNASMELLNAGFNAMDDPSVCEAVESVYARDGSANGISERFPSPFVFDRMVLYSENLHSARPAAQKAWGASGRGVSALIYGLSCGPLLLLHVQEVDETSDRGVEIENNEQRSPRDFYRRLLAVIGEPAFRMGEFYPLNPDNRENQKRGLTDDPVHSRWISSYLRYDPVSNQRMLVVVNLHPTAVMDDVRIRLALPAMRFLGWDTVAGSKKVKVAGVDRLGDMPDEASEWSAKPSEMEDPGICVKKIPPLTAAYYELILQGASVTSPR